MPFEVKTGIAQISITQVAGLELEFLQFFNQEKIKKSVGFTYATFSICSNLYFSRL